jgi:hypothetical protein
MFGRFDKLKVLAKVVEFPMLPGHGEWILAIQINGIDTMSGAANAEDPVGLPPIEEDVVDEDRFGGHAALRT